MVTSFYCGLGVYSQDLACRLLVHNKILGMLRMHSKRIITLNSSFLIFLLLSCFVAIFNLSSIDNTYKFHKGFHYQDQLQNGTNGRKEINPCQVVEIHIEICQVNITFFEYHNLCKFPFRRFGSPRWFTPCFSYYGTF